ncbi:MAG: hypothetical protein WCV63_08800 [Negativicutes bacterium]|jgi:hypothetical protein
MKKTLLVLLLCLAITGVVSATPLTDYSAGKIQIDFGLGWAIDGTSGTGSGFGGAIINDGFGGSSSGLAGNLGVTVGLSSNFALRLKNNSFCGSTYSYSYLNPVTGNTDNISGTGYISDTELDFMYQALTLDSSPVSLTVLIGFDVPVLGATVTDSNWNNYYGYSTGNIYQFNMIGGGFLGGLQLVAPINDSTNFYANGDLGTSHWGLGAGVGFALNPQFDINVGVDFKSFNVNSVNSNLNGTIYATQPNVGISYRF